MTRIWVPKMKIIEPNKEIIRPTRMRGRYKLEAVRPNGQRRLLADWFDNLITDAGLNVIGTSDSWLRYCRVGTGNTAPTFADTALAAQVASTQSKQSNSITHASESPWNTNRTIVYRFSAGTFNGDNLAEIGIATASSGGTLFSRALILDGLGSPTTITVLSDEALDCTYQIQIFPPLTDVEDTITIDGVLHDITIRASLVVSSVWQLDTNGARGGIGSIVGVGSNNAAAYSGALGTINQQPSGSSSTCDGDDDIAYGNNDLYRDFTQTWGLTRGNVGDGIQSVRALFGTEGRFGAIQIGFVPDIAKDNTKTLSLTFRHSWARGTAV